MSHAISLTIQTSDGKSVEAVFDSDSILIGSGPSAVLRLDDPGVSSIHAVIKMTREGAASVIDLGSEGGTSVNGAPVTEPFALEQGDLIQVGGVRVTVAKISAPRAHALASEDRTDELSARSGTRALPAAADLLDGVENTAKIREVRERAPASQAPAFGTRLVTEDSEIPEALLSSPLDASNRPTNEERVLEISVLWGDFVVDSVQVAEPRAITVGGREPDKRFAYFTSTTRATDLEVDGPLPADKFTLAYNQGGEAQIIVPSAAKIALRRADGTVTREASLQGADAPFPAKAYRLSVGERFAFKVGTLTFMAQFVRGNAKLGKGAVMDWYFPRVFAISAMCHAFFVVAAFITPDIDRSLVDELFRNQNYFAQILLKPEDEKKNKKLDLSGMKGGGKHKDEEGKFGKKDKPPKDALASKAGAPRVDPNKREKDRKIALNAGLLGILKGAGGAGAVSNVFGPGGLGTGINNAMGGLRGSEMGDAGGAGGLGTRGTGAGGGGNSLGIGGLGTHGHGRGTGGYGNIDLGGRGKGTTRIVPGRTIIQGSLSKEEIGRVIRRNLARFKYCYEKQLNSNPNLSGKVSVYFTIAPTGSVANASIRETSMNDNNVESCVTQVMRSLKFPNPRGGGIVVVTYPFVFAST